MIRIATESDVVGLVDTHVAAWQVAYRGIMPDSVLDNISLEKRHENWIRALQDTNRCNYVYDENARILGFASYGPSRDEDADSLIMAELIGLYVHPDAWRRGIGYSLWDRVECDLRSDFTEATLWVIQNNSRARCFYEAMGFVEETGKQRLLPWYDCELYEVRYRKSLGVRASSGSKLQTQNQNQNSGK